MPKLKKLPLALLVIGTIIICCSNKQQQAVVTKNGKVTISFTNTIHNAPLVLDSMEYSNPFGELYRVSKLKYYISNIRLNHTTQPFAVPGSYYLLDESNPASLQCSFDAAANNYTSISFTVGVDSIKNVSGAQSGALDPAHGMFWTWNSGYIFFKLEGSSPASAIINHKIEYHIGGFAGENNALQWVTLPLPAGQLLQVQQAQNCSIAVTADLDKLWQSTNDIKIATTPATMTPGALSKKIATNYSHMFTIKTLRNNAP